MVCRCSSPAEHESRYRAEQYASAQYEKQRYEKQIAVLQEEIASLTPDASNYEILDAHAVGSHLVVKVRYPSCRNCSYEGTKIMVFLNTSALDALKWRKLDPHFRNKPVDKDVAPSPAARFPASPEGWSDAITYAKGKSK